MMDPAGAEGHVGVRRAGHVEAVGPLEHRLVAVTRDQPGGDLVAGRDRGAAELGVDGGGPTEVVNRSRPTQHLLGCALAEFIGVGAKQILLVRVLAERHQPVADRVARGLVAGGGQQHEVDIELALAESGVDKVAHDVLARAVPALVGDAPAKGEHVQRGRAGERQMAMRVVVVLDGVFGVGIAEQAVADLDDLATLLLRHAEDLREDLHRDLRRDLVDEVEVALGQGPVQNRPDDLADLFLPDAKRPWV